MKKLLLLLLFVPQIIFAQESFDMIWPGFAVSPDAIGLQSADNLSDNWQQNISLGFSQNFYDGLARKQYYYGNTTYTNATARQTNMSLQFQKAIGKRILAGIRVPYAFNKLKIDNEYPARRNSIGDIQASVSGLIIDKKTVWKEKVIKNKFITRISFTAPMNSNQYETYYVLKTGNNNYVIGAAALYSLSINKSKMIVSFSSGIPIRRRYNASPGIIYQTGIQYHKSWRIKKTDVVAIGGMQSDKFNAYNIFANKDGGYSRFAAGLGYIVKYKRYYITGMAYKDIASHYNGTQMKREFSYMLETGIMF